MTMQRRLQLLDVEGILYFFELDLTMYGVPDILRFHCNGVTEDINDELNRVEHIPAMEFNGNQYDFVGLSVQGIESSSDGKINTPELKVANILNGQVGAISALCRKYNNLIDAELTIHTTTVEAYDKKTGEEITQSWWIDQKTADDGASITFDLASAMDYKKAQLPTRMIMDICTWAMRGEYRGETCSYTGTKYFDKQGNAVTTLDQDDCGGTCNDCILRFGRGTALPFGGFLIVNKTDY